jgi:hypothetical protein
MRALVLTHAGELSAMEKRRDRRGAAPGHQQCDGLIEPHIEYDREQGWRITHRCKCGNITRSDGWHSELTMIEHIFWRRLREDTPLDNGAIDS